MKVISGKDKYFADENGILFNLNYEFDKKVLKIDNIDKFNEAFNFSKRYFLSYEIDEIEFVYSKNYLIITINNSKIFLDLRDKEKFFNIALNVYKKLKEKNIKFKEIDLRYGYDHIIIR